MRLQHVGIYGAFRTPRTKAYKGALSRVGPLDLIKPLFDRIHGQFPLSKELSSHIILGCVTQVSEQGGNFAQLAAQYSSWEALSGTTLNHYCCSGLDAVGYASCRIEMGLDSLVLAGGVESMSKVPMFSDQQEFFSDLQKMKSMSQLPIGLAADVLANLHDVSREETDYWAFRSHQLGAKACVKGSISNSIVPIEVNQQLIEQDQTPDSGITYETLQDMSPIYRQLGETEFKQLISDRLNLSEDIRYVHHKGSAPTKADGASLLLVGHANLSKKFGCQPRALVRDIQNQKGDTFLGLTGGIEAMKALLKRNGLQASDIDLVEFNEPFAAPCIIAKRDLRLREDQLNVNGSAIGLGHPLGATGGMILTTLVDELERQNKTLGMAAISGAMGVGTAILVERI